MFPGNILPHNMPIGGPQQVGGVHNIIGDPQNNLQFDAPVLNLAGADQVVTAIMGEHSTQAYAITVTDQNDHGFVGGGPVGVNSLEELHIAFQESVNAGNSPEQLLATHPLIFSLRMPKHFFMTQNPQGLTTTNSLSLHAPMGIPGQPVNPNLSNLQFDTHPIPPGNPVTAILLGAQPNTINNVIFSPEQLPVGFAMILGTTALSGCTFKAGFTNGGNLYFQHDHPPQGQNLPSQALTTFAVNAELQIDENPQALPPGYDNSVTIANLVFHQQPFPPDPNHLFIPYQEENGPLELGVASVFGKFSVTDEGNRLELFVRRHHIQNNLQHPQNGTLDYFTITENNNPQWTRFEIH